MLRYYVVNHVSLTERKDQVIDEIQKSKPDKIVCFSLEEYDYKCLFGSFVESIEPYLKANNQKLLFFSPFVPAVNPFPNSADFIETLGYYHWAAGMVDRLRENNAAFEFAADSVLFTNYNNNAKYQRAMLVDEFVKHDLLKDGIVTLISPERMFMPDGTTYVFKYHTGIPLYDEMDFLLNASVAYGAGSIPRSYMRGFIDIVSESTYGPGEFFITEKTGKAIGTLKPFLVYGPPYVHKHLREKYGLVLYDELFDYSFDSEIDIQKRIEGICSNLLRLRNLTLAQLKELHKSIESKLISNRDTYIQIREDKSFVPKELIEMKNSGIEFFGDTLTPILSYL